MRSNYRFMICSNQGPTFRASDPPPGAIRAGLDWRHLAGARRSPSSLGSSGKFSGLHRGAMSRSGTPAWPEDRSAMFPLSLRPVDSYGVHPSRTSPRQAAIPVTNPEERRREPSMLRAGPLDRVQAIQIAADPGPRRTAGTSGRWVRTSRLSICTFMISQSASRRRLRAGIQATER